MKDKLDKTLEIMATITIILYIAFVIFFIIEFKEMMNDHRCYILPLNEFYQDKKCEKYWDMRNWSDKE